MAAFHFVFSETNIIEWLRERTE